MEYYVVDKCLNASKNLCIDVDTSKYKIFCTSFLPYGVKTKTVNKHKYYDFSKPVKHYIMFEHRREKKELRNICNDLYLEDVDVYPELVNDVTWNKYGDNEELEDIRRRYCQYSYTYRRNIPKLCITYTVCNTDNPKDKLIELPLDQTSKYQFQSIYFDKSIDICLTPNVKVKKERADDYTVKSILTMSIQGSSNVKINGEEYFIDSNRINNIYLQYLGDERWKFYCLFDVEYTTRPTVTEVSESKFKLLDKRNADIVVYNNKTYLMKNTTNDNTVFDFDKCADHHDKELRVKFDDDITHYVSYSLNCKNCYNCFYCRDCNNCSSMIYCNNCADYASLKHIDDGRRVKQPTFSSTYVYDHLIKQYYSTETNTNNIPVDKHIDSSSDKSSDKSSDESDNVPANIEQPTMNSQISKTSLSTYCIPLMTTLNVIMSVISCYLYYRYNNN